MSARGNDAKQEGIVKKAVEHIGFDSAFFGDRIKIGAMQSQRVLSESVERNMRLFRGKSGKVLGKHYVQHPVHTFNFPMFPRNLKQFLGGNIRTGNIIAGFSTGSFFRCCASVNGKNTF